MCLYSIYGSGCLQPTIKYLQDWLLAHFHSERLLLKTLGAMCFSVSVIQKKESTSVFVFQVKRIHVILLQGSSSKYSALKYKRCTTEFLHLKDLKDLHTGYNVTKKTCFKIHTKICGIFQNSPFHGRQCYCEALLSVCVWA